MLHTSQSIGSCQYVQCCVESAWIHTATAFNLSVRAATPSPIASHPSGLSSAARALTILWSNHEPSSCMTWLWGQLSCSPRICRAWHLALNRDWLLQWVWWLCCSPECGLWPPPPVQDVVQQSSFWAWASRGAGLRIDLIEPEWWSGGQASLDLNTKG